ncbi:hypothetical protein NIES22_57860 [Calothrix brevissima NIES-22]|nr:hypothetical protein NIES22_57860 [Calothrix brevissima NIES-22]
MKLNQAIAVIQTIKEDSRKRRTEIYHLLQKPELFDGLSRTYEPSEEEGFVYPAESKVLQFKAEDLLKQYEQAAKDLFDFAATQDFANTQAKADVVINGTAILKDVPVTYLLFLEKQIEDIRALVAKLPILDTSEEWHLDQQQDCWASSPKRTTKTKQILKPVVLYEATDKHPAQVKESSEQVPEGIWKSVKFSGALSRSRVNQLKERLDTLERAVIFAREQANAIEVEKKSVSDAIFSYLFAP